MIKKNKLYVILIVLVAVTFVWLNSLENNEESPNKSSADNDSPDSQKIVRNLEGVLWFSDEITKGNMMLAGNGMIIYLKTSRDFGGLVGKNVIATVDGTLENFVLINIEENLTKNGFIQTQ